MADVHWLLHCWSVPGILREMSSVLFVCWLIYWTPTDCTTPTLLEQTLDHWLRLDWQGHSSDRSLPSTFYLLLSMHSHHTTVSYAWIMHWRCHYASLCNCCGYRPVQKPILCLTPLPSFDDQDLSIDFFANLLGKMETVPSIQFADP